MPLFQNFLEEWLVFKVTPFNYFLMTFLIALMLQLFTPIHLSFFITYDLLRWIGIVLLLIASGFIVDSRWFLLMGFILMERLQQYIIPKEEKILKQSFGENYREYRLG